MVFGDGCPDCSVTKKTRVFASGLILFTGLYIQNLLPLVHKTTDQPQPDGDTRGGSRGGDEGDASPPTSTWRIFFSLPIPPIASLFNATSSE